MTIEEPEWWEQWTYFDEQAREVKLKEDAPEDIKREFGEIMAQGDYGEPKIEMIEE